MSAYLQSLRQAVAKAKQLPRGGFSLSSTRCADRLADQAMPVSAFSPFRAVAPRSADGARNENGPPVIAGPNYRYWTWDEDLILRRMVKTGYSFSQIGKVLERTKDSCIGRFHRLAAREGAR